MMQLFVCDDDVFLLMEGKPRRVDGSRDIANWIGEDFFYFIFFLSADMS